MKHSIPLIALIVLVATLLILPGCNQETPSSSEVTPKDDNPSSETETRSVTLIADTPEAVFASMREATEERDYHTFAACWTEASQNKIAVGLVQEYIVMLKLRQQGVRSNVDSMREIIERYEIDAELVAAILDSAGLPLEERIAEAGVLIHDKREFIGDAMTLINRDSAKDEAIQGELDSIVIEGDRAAAWCVLPEDGGEMKIEFVNTPEGWRIELPEADPVGEDGDIPE